MSDSPTTIATYIIELLNTGSFSSTYKHAVLIGLMDLCLEKDAAYGTNQQQLITTQELAEKVIALYWPQTRETKLIGRRIMPTAEGIRFLWQNPQGKLKERGGGIVAEIGDFRRRELSAGGSRPNDADPLAYATLRDKVEWKLIEMPLPKLEGTMPTRKLFEMGWDESGRPPKQSVWQRYLRTNRGFDNGIRVYPSTALCFRMLHGMLRPYIQLHWAMRVAKFNGLEVEELHDELFGCERSSLASVRDPLVAIQSGRCFYCDQPISGTAEVDHFIPWSMQNNDCIFNLVAADRRCNNAKRDMLASRDHVEAWVRRYDAHAQQLERIATEKRWTCKPEPTRLSARNVYSSAREDASLWAGVSKTKANERDAIMHAFASLHA
jgi:hypothetical protein